MSLIENFLTSDEEKEIINTIRLAEKQSSGEIRIHLEKTCKNNPDKRAIEVFSILKMDQTKLQNGVLIYVAVHDKTFAIYGDKGINDLVPADFWNTTKDAIQKQFNSGNFKQGLIAGITEAGSQLKKHFPWDKSDTNELSNEISKG